jgi:Uma2 family endonuclease
MAATVTPLTIEEYHERFAHVKGAEFWFGEVRYKSVPTWLHAVLQIVLGQLFDEAGYVAGSELELRIDPQWEPKPDVAAALVIEHPYPTKAIEIAVEIVSPGDSLEQVREKCAHYTRIGIRQVFVLDPEAKTIAEWRGGELQPVIDVALGNGVTITGKTIWRELERRISGPQPPTSKII